MNELNTNDFTVNAITGSLSDQTNEVCDCLGGTVDILGKVAGITRDNTNSEDSL